MEASGPVGGRQCSCHSLRVVVGLLQAPDEGGHEVKPAPPDETGCEHFLAALSSSRSVVVGPSVGRSVRPLVGHLCEKVTFRVLNCN